MDPKYPNTTFPHFRNAPLNAKNWHQCLYTLHLMNTVGVKQALPQMEHVLQYIIPITSFIKIFFSTQVRILVKVITNVPIEYNITCNKISNMSLWFIFHAILLVPDNKYALAFQATGCPNEYPNIDYWKTQTDNAVFSDMFLYCTSVRDEVANIKQKLKCCGSTDCKPGICTEQLQWTAGIKYLCIHLYIISSRWCKIIIIQ